MKQFTTTPRLADYQAGTPRPLPRRLLNVDSATVFRHSDCAATLCARGHNSMYFGKLEADSPGKVSGTTITMITRTSTPISSCLAIDLRILCDDDRDFANPIEPSVHGGAKIAKATLSFAAPGGPPYSRVIAR